MITKKNKIFNYANIALDELKNLAPADSIQLPDLILLDIQMPYINGWQFKEEFQKFPAAILKDVNYSCLVLLKIQEILRDQKRIKWLLDL